MQEIQMAHSAWLKSVRSKHHPDPVAVAASPQHHAAVVRSFLQPLPTDCLLMKCRTLLGQTLFNHHGEAIGMLSNIVLDLHTGRISYAVLAFPISLGCPARLFAVPWHALVRSGDQLLIEANGRRGQLPRQAYQTLIPPHAQTAGPDA